MRMNLAQKSLVITLLLLLTGRFDSAFAQQQAIPTVRVEKVRMLDSSEPKRYTGTVRAKEEVNIIPRVSGYLEKVAFDEGALIKKGDLLFRIEDTVYEINVEVAKAAIEQIEAEIDLAEKDFERTEQLHDQNVATQQEMDHARRSIKYNKARLRQARAELHRAENDLSYTKIYSPIEGKVGAKMYSEGNYVTQSSGVLASIIQYDPITVQFPMSERDFMKNLRDNGGYKTANIRILRADDTPYEGEFEIDYVDNRVQSGMLMVRLLCENPNSDFYPGGFARILLSEKFEKPLPSIHVSGLMTDGTRYYLFVLDADDKIVRRDVRIGSQVKERQIILSGVEPDETVVIGGLNKVRPGMTVEPVPAQASASP